MKPFIFLFLFLIFILDVAAIGVYPSSLEYENVIKRQIIAREITIYNTKDKAAEYSIMADRWFSFEPSRIRITAGNSSKVKVKLKIPEETANGVYNAKIYVSEIGNGKGVALNEGVIVKVRLNVNNKVKVDGAAYKILARDAFIDEAVVFVVGLQNLGNVNSDFDIVFDVNGENFNQKFRKILNVDAYERKDFEVEWFTNKIGKYDADVYVYLGDRLLGNETVYFEVYEGEVLEEVKRDEGNVLMRVAPLVRKPEIAIFAFFSLLIIVLCFLNFFRK